MGRDLKAFFGLAVCFCLCLGSYASAMERENGSDRDLTLKESVDHSADREKGEIGELERESDHELYSETGGHESLHDGRESAGSELHESTGADSHDASGGAKEPVEHESSK
jgi:hypothetical protein